LSIYNFYNPQFTHIRLEDFIKDLFRNDLSKAVVLTESKTKGFIAPPIIANITQDGIYDIIANAVDGKIIAIDGATGKILWETSFSGTELYSSLAIGFFNADSIPGFFVNGGLDISPHIRESSQIMLNGKNGKVEYRADSGSFIYASPEVTDYNDDGFDDVLMNINASRTSVSYRRGITTQLYTFDFHRNTRNPIGGDLTGSNIACTFWIGDVDHDGKQDIISSTIKLVGRNNNNNNNNNYNNNVDRPSDLRIFRLKTAVPVNLQIKESAYMAPNYDGIFIGVPSGKISYKVTLTAP